MAVTAAVYNQGLVKMLSGFDFENNQIKVGILSSSYTPNIDSHEYWDDVSTREVSGTGYTAGGQILAGTSDGIDVYKDTINDRATVEEVDDLVWSKLTVNSIRYVVFYHNTGTAGTSTLLFYLNLGKTYNLVNQDFSVLFQLTQLLRLAKKAA